MEILGRDEAFDVGRYAILEVQTMDFHGTYERAVMNLRDALRLHGTQFHQVLRQNGGRWLSERVDGPNIANVFKRTFYQMMLKFQVARHESCAGCALAIPAAVWDSWQRHLGKPELLARGDGSVALLQPGSTVPERVPAWVYVFDIDASETTTPNPIVIRNVIATDAEAIAYFSTVAAPEAAIGGPGSTNLLISIRRRLGGFWPELLPGRARR